MFHIIQLQRCSHAIFVVKIMKMQCTSKHTSRCTYDRVNFLLAYYNRYEILNIMTRNMWERNVCEQNVLEGDVIDDQHSVSKRKSAKKKPDHVIQVSVIEIISWNKYAFMFSWWWNVKIHTNYCYCSVSCARKPLLISTCTRNTWCITIWHQRTVRIKHK